MIRPAPLSHSPSERLGGLACRVALATALAAPLTASAISVANSRFEVDTQLAGARLVVYSPSDERVGAAESVTTDHAPEGSPAEVSPSAAVAASEAYALLLAGLGAAGFISHRRRRT